MHQVMLTGLKMAITTSCTGNYAGDEGARMGAVRCELGSQNRSGAALASLS